MKIKIIQKILNKNQYQNVKINGIMFIMKNFTGQKFGIILKDWTSVIKLKNSNGNATITLFTPKVDVSHSYKSLLNLIFNYKYFFT